MNNHSIQAILTDACNWSCSYCNKRPKQHKVDYDYILDSIEYIFKYHKQHLKHFNLSGGEPGLLSTKFWKEIIKLIHKYDMKDQVDLYTNGLMFKHEDVIEELISSIHKVKWHCIEGFNKTIEPHQNILHHSNIEQIVIYHESNYIQFIKWLNLNKLNIRSNFTVVMDSNHLVSEESKAKLTHTINCFNKTFNKSIRLKYDTIHEPSISNRIECMKRYTTMRINYSNNTITPCCKIVSSNIPLTEFSLNQMLTNQISAYSTHCLNCKILMM